jgi:hypothetical protein
MRTISTSLFMSLDAVVEADNDWQFPYLDEETFAALTVDWEHSDAVLLGRRSFDGFDDVRRSSPDSPVVGFLDSVSRYVVPPGADGVARWWSPRCRATYVTPCASTTRREAPTHSVMRWSGQSPGCPLVSDWW